MLGVCVFLCHLAVCSWGQITCFFCFFLMFSLLTLLYDAKRIVVNVSPSVEQICPSLPGVPDLFDMVRECHSLYTWWEFLQKKRFFYNLFIQCVGEDHGSFKAEKKQPMSKLRLYFLTNSVLCLCCLLLWMISQVFPVDPSGAASGSAHAHLGSQSRITVVIRVEWRGCVLYLLVSEEPTFELDECCDLEQEACCEYSSSVKVGISCSAAFFFYCVSLVKIFFCYFRCLFGWIQTVHSWRQIKVICIRTHGNKVFIYSVGTGKRVALLFWEGERAVYHLCLSSMWTMRSFLPSSCVHVHCTSQRLRSNLSFPLQDQMKAHSVGMLNTDMCLMISLQRRTRRSRRREGVSPVLRFCPRTRSHLFEWTGRPTFCADWNFNRCPRLLSDAVRVIEFLISCTCVLCPSDSFSTTLVPIRRPYNHLHLSSCQQQLSFFLNLFNLNLRINAYNNR